MCTNSFNKTIIKNKYPIPLVADLFDKLDKGQYLTKLDLHSRYYQVCITKGGEPKTTCIIRYGSFEFLVILFGLTNAPAIFYILINKVLQPFYDRFIVVYLDTIVVNSTTLEEHAQHWWQVLQVLYDLFTQWEVKFLGHKIVDRKLMKRTPSPPTKAPKLRSFPELVIYNHRFIKGCLAKANVALVQYASKFSKIWRRLLQWNLFSLFQTILSLSRFKQMP